MHTAIRELPGRQEVLAATADHPYARLTTGGREVLGYEIIEYEVKGSSGRGNPAGGVVGWCATGSRGRALYVLGDPHPADHLVAALEERGALAGVRWVHLPAALSGRPPGPARVQEPVRWQFRWATAEPIYTPLTHMPPDQPLAHMPPDHVPPAQPDEDRVVTLESADEPAIQALLDRAHPGSTTRPGHSLVRGWYGIREGGQLVACGADRSRDGTGELAGIVVDPACRGSGLGRALVARMTRLLLARYGVVGLGVMADKPAVVRLYRGMGFVRSIDRTTLELAR